MTGKFAKKAAAVLVPGVSLAVFALPGTAVAAPAAADGRAAHGLCAIPVKLVDRLPVCHRVNGWQ
ncbi:hypothetical protein IPZ58_00445 [Streptomyces roseoverticillatus]|uniref:hypothetical protein n=1 Tax=Streptomyces roseoverticillatus TaxID=66429 RepID=UPI001F343B23|nr:hypothetical protein [Streptomyces roseoverticillatus]MCF3100060.1 hypothetical protein [Streptomyces roseoverticillatus]